MPRNVNRETTFRFKKFSVVNNRSAMKVGTDGVLLGAWSRLPEDECHVVDAGCGTGLISLMIAQRYPSAAVTGVEIDAQAAAEAEFNRLASPFADRIGIIKGDFADLRVPTMADAVISNPPFFTEALHSPDASRAMARHADGLPLDILFRKAGEILRDIGTVSLIMPADRDDDVVFEAAMRGFSPSRHCSVSTAVSRPAKRSLWEFSRRSDVPLADTRLSIRDCNGDYTEEYIKLVDDFYIKL